mmetsp:Transcript_31952/g.81095  ORF Transcript_31952/g.81095 Transcript_31952/m.81095 type:complete len:212 (-) Transcript_31952:863-1498(-)
MSSSRPRPRVLAPWISRIMSPRHNPTRIASPSGSTLSTHGHSESHNTSKPNFFTSTPKVILVRFSGKSPPTSGDDERAIGGFGRLFAASLASSSNIAAETVGLPRPPAANSSRVGDADGCRFCCGGLPSPSLSAKHTSTSFSSSLKPPPSPPCSDDWPASLAFLGFSEGAEAAAAAAAAAVVSVRRRTIVPSMACTEVSQEAAHCLKTPLI